jgi:hypothetical protein
VGATGIMWGQTYKFRLEKIYLHLLIFIMVNIIDIDETLGAPVPNTINKNHFCGYISEYEAEVL